MNIVMLLPTLDKIYAIMFTITRAQTYTYVERKLKYRFFDQCCSFDLCVARLAGICRSFTVNGKIFSTFVRFYFLLALPLFLIMREAEIDVGN